MKTKNVFIASTSIIACFFFVFVVFYWNYAHVKEQQRVDTHSKVIASAIWDFDTESLSEYWKLASKAYNYKQILVAKPTGEKIIDVKSSLHNPIDQFLSDIGLLPTSNIESNVNYQNQAIGTVTVTWYNTGIYTLSYAFIIVLLILTILWFFLRTIRAKQELEIRVSKRTEHLQKEIIERKHAENELKQFSQRLAIHIEQTPLGVIEFDSDFKIVQWNKAAEKIFGFTHDEAIGQQAIDLIIPETSRNDAGNIWRDLLAKKGGKKSKEQNITKDGKKISCEWYNTTLVDPEGVVIGIASLVLDISEAELLEKRLQQSQKMEAIGTLAGGIAHDFNNILGVILGYTEMAKEDSASGSVIDEDLGMVIDAVNRAKSLVQQILAFSRQDNTERVPMQPADIVKEAISMLRPSLPSTIDINQDIDTGTGLVLANSTQLSQILLNLCTNSFHAMEEKGGILDISLKEVFLSSEDLVHEPDVTEGTFIQLSVGDSGPGIASNIKDRIFDPFFTTKETDKGTGMGLSMVHGIVKSYGGFVSLYSEPGEGTIFHVYLPVIEKKALPENKTIAQVPTGRERILFVDDEEILANMGKTMLERLGYHVTVRKSSLEALEIFQDQSDKFDLVITDQTMPGMTGSDLSRRMLQIRPDIPIILCTGYSSIISEDKAKSIGIKEFALKPLTKKDLAKLIRKVMDVS